LGLFDSVRRRRAGAADASAQELAALRAKYRSVLAAVESAQVKVQNLHAADGRLYLKGVTPSEAVRARILDEVRRAGGEAGDIVVDLTVAPACPPPDEVH
jgi:hypothetical protein